MTRNTPTASPRARIARTATTLLASAVLVATLIAPPGATPAAAAAAPPDGLSQGTAAASCWEIKQNTPAAGDGVYWLVTPALRAPQQFYCDQTTDGGGWVLIARGREGWKGQYTGLRSAVTLRTVVTGQSAFATAQLPATTVDGLLNNGRVDALQDRVRIKRALDAEGTQWQEVRFAFASRDRWVWTFGAEHRVGNYSFDGVNGSGGQTNNFGRNSAFQRVDANAPQAQGYVGGLAYGSQVAGTNSASTYLYSATNGGGNARPFAQMFLRPRLLLAQLDFGAVPDAGIPAITQAPLPESEAISTVWGVSGLANGRDGELNTEVAVFGQVGSTVYVGGNFRYVQRTQTSTGADRIEQPYLAGFNVSTGQFVSGFRPQLNGQVKALAALPDGRLAVGGQFTTASGQAAPSIVFLDPATGLPSGSQVAIENRSTGGVPQVRGMSVQGNYLYLAGSMTHVAATGRPTASAWNAARIILSTGAPDTNWNPTLNGTSVGVDASLAGDRTYFSGYFKQAKTVQAISAAAVQTAAGANLATPSWTPLFSKPGVDYAGNVWQLGIKEAGGNVWVGGSEHSLFSYERSTFARNAGHITKNGGDFQVVTAGGGTIFAGCHCGDWTYSNAYAWSGIGTGWTQGDKISLFGAWDAASGAYLPQFGPLLQARRGFGVWGIFQDSTGTVWAGGDLERSVRAGEVNQWAGGFTRFRARDAASPTTPAALTTVITGGSALISWQSSSDDRGVSGYEVLADGRVVATTTSTSISIPVEEPTTKYVVRATDAAGNRSASTPSFTLTVPPPDPEPETVTLVANAGTWRWRYSSDPWDATWNTAAFDDAAWATGSAPLGFGHASIATDVAAGVVAPRPLSAQYRVSFDASQVATFDVVNLTLVVDDGAVVYLNGTEIGRANLPAGTLTQSSYATAAPRTTTALANRVTLPVPLGLLVDGENTVAVSTHLNYRSTPDSSFDLALVAERQ